MFLLQKIGEHREEQGRTAETDRRKTAAQYFTTAYLQYLRNSQEALSNPGQRSRWIIGSNNWSAKHLALIEQR